MLKFKLVQIREIHYIVQDYNNIFIKNKLFNV